VRRLFLAVALLITAVEFTPAQTLNNLQIIWRKCQPVKPVPSGETRWGDQMTSGDYNGDGYSDIVSYTDSVISSTRGKCEIYMFLGGLSMDTIYDKKITVDSIGYHPSLTTGDFNGDGRSDLVVADSRGLDEHETGIAYIYYGTDQGLPDTFSIIHESWWHSSFGCDISAGDLNNDGYDDLMVGAYAVLSDIGRVYIYYGSSAGLQNYTSTVLNGHDSPVYNEGFGIRVGSGGDFNNDGYQDIIISGYGNSEAYNCAGRIYIYYGGNPMDTLADVWADGEGLYNTIGYKGVAIAPADSGGCYGAGCYSAPDYPDGWFGAIHDGKIYMLAGGLGIDGIPDFTVTHPGSEENLGMNLSNGGYVDNDKRADIISGGPYWDNNKGMGYLWLARDDMRTQQDADILGRFPANSNTGEVMGSNMTSAGDVDGDGKDEIMFSNYISDISDTSVFIWICKYTGPDGVAGKPADSGQRPAFRLGQNYPNPFKTKTTISYQLQVNGSVNLSVYNITGQLVRILDNGYRLSGVYNVKWNGVDIDGRTVSKGVYIYKLTLGNICIAQKMILLK